MKYLKSIVSYVKLSAQYQSGAAITWGSTVPRSSRNFKHILWGWGESSLNISLEEVLTAGAVDETAVNETTVISNKISKISRS